MHLFLLLAIIAFVLLGEPRRNVSAFVVVHPTKVSKSRVHEKISLRPRSAFLWTLPATPKHANHEEKEQSLPPLPSFNQLLLGSVVGLSGFRIVQSINEWLFFGNVTVLNVVFNGILLSGAVLLLFQSFQKIDYATLEDVDQKSLAWTAGTWALAGTVPESFDDTLTVATFAGGCFWGTELHFQRLPGVLYTCVGYTQGNVEQPTYEQVCSGSTGHTEGIQMVFDSKVISYEALVRKLLDTINPTLLNRVGNDRGTQYRHGIYTHTSEQAKVAKAVLDKVQNDYSDPIVTEMRPARVFWPAENYHQRYLEKGGQSAEKNCEERVRCYG